MFKARVYDRGILQGVLKLMQGVNALDTDSESDCQVRQSYRGLYAFLFTQVVMCILQLTSSFQLEYK